MTTHIQYFGCDARPEWEEKLQALFLEARQHKAVTDASARVEEPQNAAYRYRISVTFRIPGPDIQLQGNGYTFDEALMSVRASLRQTLKLRAEKAMHHDGATRGVKAAHRG
ncbi:hypothetical protein SAMN02745166_02347 [Prosthecobacter debontii]|uniref:Sigma 54 modulation protein / S30EA ribosomal protein n=1 Tax=Prosthecobacter debontii TaxID=48467 RepID=A0A1T4Y2I3_9BACT|nr:hypothetical protein [Prosthecobacter debontii]SKA96047.1 hypothetical protein SAMN02745166_02347 [Prosthecobacter debontii]